MGAAADVVSAVSAGISAGISVVASAVVSAVVASVVVPTVVFSVSVAACGDSGFNNDVIVVLGTAAVLGSGVVPDAAVGVSANWSDMLLAIAFGCSLGASTTSEPSEPWIFCYIPYTLRFSSDKCSNDNLTLSKKNEMESRVS